MRGKKLTLKNIKTHKIRTQIYIQKNFYLETQIYLQFIFDKKKKKENNENQLEPQLSHSHIKNKFLTTIPESMHKYLFTDVI